MQQISRDALRGISIEVGSLEIIENMPTVSNRPPFSEEVIEYLNEVSTHLMKSRDARSFPDVVTLAFWLRKSNLLTLKEEHCDIYRNCIVRGRGMLFHIAPSNVPVNYAYSLACGLLFGNSNVVKIPSKDFRQVALINEAISSALDVMPGNRPYIALVRYGHEKTINDALSEYADGRIIWGGDATVAEVRKSPLSSRAVEVSFADRYSLAVVDSDCYLALDDKDQLAKDFFNDTFLTDQNACTSPRAVIWTGSSIVEAKKVFWDRLQVLVEKQYEIAPVQVVNKLSNVFRVAALRPGSEYVHGVNNYITRVKVTSIDDSLMSLKESSGFFFEYDCDSFEELRAVCDNVHCQTISYLGNRKRFENLLSAGLKGVDRIVPIGRTMDFELIWDGYDLAAYLTRVIRVN